MKRIKIVSVVSLLIVIALLLPLTSCMNSIEKIQYAIISENNISDDGLIYNIYENKTAVITGAQSESEELVIPDEVDGYAVVEIGENAFSGKEMLLLVTIGKNVTMIGANAFSECPYLARVQMVPEAMAPALTVASIATFRLLVSFSASKMRMMSMPFSTAFFTNSLTKSSG